MLVQLVQEVRGILEERFNRLKKRAIALAVAVVLLACAFLFALIATFIALQEAVGAAGAALILFIVLLAGGLVALMAGRQRLQAERAQELRAIEQNERAQLSTGRPESRLTSSGWPLILTAFAAGLALSKGRLSQWRRGRR